MTAIKQIPILFSTDMVKAILSDRKSMTRRIIKPQPIDNTEIDGNFFTGDHKGYVKVDGHPDWQHQFAHEFCKYQVGDVLWVRETFLDGEDYPCSEHHEDDSVSRWAYKADCPQEQWKVYIWKPSIYMPKEAARIWLEVTDVRVERLHSISKKDAIAEGIAFDEIGYKDYDKERAKGYGHPDHDYPHVQDARISFLSLWESIYGFESRSSNPWVWPISFKRIDKPE